MRISPLTFQIILPNNQRLNIGTLDQFNNNVNLLSLPRKSYQVYAPILGTCSTVLGNQTFDFKEQYKRLLNIVLDEPYLQHQKFIKDCLRNHFMAKGIVYQLYINLKMRNEPWDSNKAIVLTRYKAVFINLVDNGAEWLHIFNQEQSAIGEADKNDSWLETLKHNNSRNSFKDLIDYVFGTSSLGNLLNSTLFSGKMAFEDYINNANDLLKLGANINGICLDAPDYGTFLHRYLANEAPFSVELIAYIESKRDVKLSHTCFNYRFIDKRNQTPLLLSIITRQENAALALLQLHSKGIDIGINIPDNNGRTPIQIAAALGLSKVVLTLLKLGADILHKDKNSKIFIDYFSLTENDLKILLLPILNPERGDITKHSHLSYNDSNRTPLCLYEDNEQEKFGDDQLSQLVILSPLPQHQKRINKVIKLLEQAAIDNKPNAKELLSFVLRQKLQIGNRTFLIACKEGQQETQQLLKSQEAKNYIANIKEKALRRACALGDLNTIQMLLHENIDPNMPDNMGRTAMHFAVMRFELVKKELNMANYEIGIDCIIKDNDVIECMKLHAQVITMLFEQSKIPINIHLPNKANNTAENILQRDAKKLAKTNEDRINTEIAKDCQKIIDHLIRNSSVKDSQVEAAVTPSKKLDI